LIYEMLTGLPPFYTKDREELFRRIKRGELIYPSYIGHESKTLVQALMIKDPDKRLGGGVAGGEEVKQHVFFAGVDWDAVYAREVAPPFTPKVEHQGDVKYFDKEFVNLPVVNSEVKETHARDDKHFDGFTYTAETTV